MERTRPQGDEIYIPESAFEMFYEIERAKDEAVHEHDSYTGFRILKNVLMGPMFGAVSLNAGEVRSLVESLIENNKYAKDFRDWIEDYELYWELGWLSETARNVYEAGKKIIENRNRSK